MASNKDKHVARIAVNLSGSLKKKFFEDVDKQGLPQAKVARKIFQDYYERQKENEGKNRF